MINYVAGLEKFAATTPYELKDLQQAAIQNLATGAKPDQILKDLKSIGDVAAGANTSLGNIANQLAQLAVNQLISGIFGGGGVPGGGGGGGGFLGGLLGFNQGGVVPNYAMGGSVAAVADALHRERAASGRNPLLAARLSLTDVVWHVEAANRKAYHYTLADGDLVEAAIEIPGTDHLLHPILGHSPEGAENPLIPSGVNVPLGDVQVIRPNPSWPELRLRITPPQGLIYAPSNSSDRNLTQLIPLIQDQAAFLRQINCALNPNAAWPNWNPGPENNQDPRTNLGGLYAQDPNNTSLGFLDDCNEFILQKQSDAVYLTLIVFLKLAFAMQDEKISGASLRQAISLMFKLNAINFQLAEKNLTPLFTIPKWWESDPPVTSQKIAQTLLSRAKEQLRDSGVLQTSAIAQVTQKAPLTESKVLKEPILSQVLQKAHNESIDEVLAHFDDAISQTTFQ